MKFFLFFWTCDFLLLEFFVGHVVVVMEMMGSTFVLQNLKSQGSLQMLKNT